jgi:ADP-ribose pyrophosphatase
MDIVSMPDGAETLREIIHHPGGVVIIPVDEDENVWCVRQYRYAHNLMLLEVPAGKLEYGEEPRDCAIRELSEETGIKADELISLGGIFPSPGISAEVLHIYLATGLNFGIAHPDENELLKIETHKLDSLVAMAISGEIQDSKSIIAILRARAYLNRE